MEKECALFISSNGISFLHCKKEIGINIKLIGKSCIEKHSDFEKYICVFLDFDDFSQIELFKFCNTSLKIIDIPVVLYSQEGFCHIKSLTEYSSWFKGRSGWEKLKSTLNLSAKDTKKKKFCTIEFLEKMKLAAAGEDNVLILGPSGCGKTWAAEQIHKMSLRNGQTFIKPSAAELNSDIVESQLFGSVKGAYTGCLGSKGIFEEASGGTLLFDEIAELPLALQSKLLRVIETRTFCKVGSTKELPFDCRLIFATNADIKSLVKKKLFREDLYYRINTLRIEIPSLKERAHDIPSLAEGFVKPRKLKLSTSALKKLCECSWPGNVRQLRNVVELACTSCKAHSREEIIEDDIFIDDWD